MARLVFTESASADEAVIIGDLNAKGGSRTAATFRQMFAALYNRLADFPASGPRRVAPGPEIRIGVVAPFIVIYRHSESDDSVTVLRVIRGRQDITRNLIAERR